MITIKVESCHKCPFVNIDNECGHDFCHAKEIKLKKWEELPHDKVHDECPLISDKILIEL